MGKKKTKQRQNEETILEIPAERQQSAPVPAQPSPLANLPADMRVLGEFLAPSSPLAGIRNLEAVVKDANRQFYDGLPAGGVRRSWADIKTTHQVIGQFNAVKQRLIEAYGEQVIVEIDTRLAEMRDELEQPLRDRQRLRQREEIVWQQEHSLRYNPTLINQREERAHQLKLREMDQRAAERLELRQRRLELEAEAKERPSVKLREQIQAANDAEDLMEELQRNTSMDEARKRRMVKAVQAAQKRVYGEETS